MPRLPPEILGHIFRLLKEAQGSKLDFLAASLVCTLWHMEAQPLFDPVSFQVNDLLLKNYIGHSRLIRRVRLYSLLAESLRYGLNYCDHLKSIAIDVTRVNDGLRACAAAIHQIMRLHPPSLQLINITYHWIPYVPAAVIELLDIIFPPGEVVSTTSLTICSNKKMGHGVTIQLLERLGPTLCNFSLSGSQFDATLLEALGRCRGLQQLSVCMGLHPGSGVRRAPPDSVAILAAALPNLTTLLFSARNFGKKVCVSNDQLREIVTRLPGLKRLMADADRTVNDECLRFVVRHAKKMEDLELIGCESLRGEGVWTENDVGCRGLRRLRLSGAFGISSSFIRLLQQECPGLSVELW
ncbi:hypothetical protein BC938DRAFT_475484 [Jimgerdemannia flammicorona]|uniref:F-box domain-containing protein n=1 Tax=Jimgerdemannia flammicorona TaxID=994334 RepID=A0A433PTX6_9FUNG|nr:hypothetical protein BC938DRAFT_475484 [Jimgerdemannia flammicorona]